jgi:hypothetical protein
MLARIKCCPVAIEDQHDRLLIRPEAMCDLGRPLLPEHLIGDVEHPPIIGADKPTRRPEVLPERLRLTVQLIAYIVGVIIPLDQQEDVTTTSRPNVD